MNQQQIMAQVKKMQAEMTRAQEELAATSVTGTAGGGAVTVGMTCEYRVTSIKVAKDAIDPEDAETLEDLLVVAVNDAVANAKAATEKRMSTVTGGMRIPGMM